MRARPASLLAALALLAAPALLGGCGGKLTELVLVIDSDIPAPSQIDAMHVVVTGPSGMHVLDTVTPYTGAPPLSIGLVPRGSVLQPVTILVEAQKSGALVLSRTVVTGFDAGVSRVIHVRLVRGCLGNTCATAAPPQTCNNAATCVEPMVDASHEPTFSGKISVPELCNGYDDDGDGVTDNGFDLNTDPTHCGTCTNACPGGEPCVGGSCSASPVIQVTVGVDHACALRMGGTVACWGGNGSNDLGSGDGVQHHTPTTVSGVIDAIQIAAGFNYTCAVRRNGHVVCWGSNGSGESGIPDTSMNVLSPMEVPGVTDAVLVDNSNIHTCVTRMGGGAQCWGANTDGRLGVGSLVDMTMTPGAVLGLSDAARVSVGGDHSCAVERSGAVTCWGADTRHQLGDATTTSRPAPVTPVAMIAGATDISSSDGFSCTVHDMGAYCWGDNPGGQIGLAPPAMWDPTMGPVHIMGVTGVASVSAATSNGAAACSACALTTAGGVSCWGCNSHGELGDGTMASRSTAAPVTGLSSGVLQLDVGATSACVVKTDHTVWCWGDNALGQLGDGTTTRSTVPVHVPTL